MERHELNNLVFEVSDRYGQSPYLSLGLIKAMSHWCQNMVIYDPLQTQFFRRCHGSGSTETILQRCRWGLFQIYGCTARRLGFTGTLTDLVHSDVNINWGVRYLADLSINYRGTDLVTAFVGASGEPSERDASVAQRVFRYETEYNQAAMKDFMDKESGNA